MSDQTDLYRYFDNNGRLLYVGISFSAIARACQHKSNSDWFGSISHMTVEKYQTREDASKAEIEAIQNEKPIYNKTFVKSKIGRKCFDCGNRTPDEKGEWEDELWLCHDCLARSYDESMREYMACIDRSNCDYGPEDYDDGSDDYEWWMK